MNSIDQFVDQDNNIEKYFAPNPAAVEQRPVVGNRSSFLLPEQKHRARLRFEEGNTLLEKGRKEDAAECFAEAVTLAPSNTKYLLRLGQVEFESGRLEESALCFEKLARLDPQNPSIWLTLGYIRFQLGHYAEAVLPLSEASMLDPLSVDGTLYLAESLRKLERFEESLPLYQKLLEVGFDRPQAVYGYGLALLALGHFEQGWEAFEFRRLTQPGTWQQHVLEDWNGEVTPHLSLFAYSEENIASDLMYASCLPDLARAFGSNGSCVVECQTTLHTLFSRSFPELQFVSPDSQHSETPQPQTVHDLPLESETRQKQVAFGSLPRFFRPNPQSFPQTTSGYLKADPALREKWVTALEPKLPSATIPGTTRPMNSREIARQKMKHNAAAKSTIPPLKVGILWQGTWTAEREEQRTLPLELLRPLLSLGRTPSRKTIQWTSLQGGSASAALPHLRAAGNVEIAHFPQLFQSHSLEELAALVSVLDLVITPPGYLANLAGALGVRTWCIAPAPADWRWFLVSGSPEEESSLWFPSMRIFRQKNNQPFTEVFAQVQRELDRILQ